MMAAADCNSWARGREHGGSRFGAWTHGMAELLSVLGLSADGGAREMRRLWLTGLVMSCTAWGSGKRGPTTASMLHGEGAGQEDDAGGS
jgi:hypothetical protein